MVEGARLESVYRETLSWVRIPFSPPISFIKLKDNHYLIFKPIIPSQYLENLECRQGNFFLIF